jgi:hypothetical protein
VTLTSALIVTSPAAMGVEGAACAMRAIGTGRGGE